MAAKKKITKKTPAKTTTKKAAKPAAKAPAKAAASKVEASTNVSTLVAAGVIDSKELTPSETAAIDDKLTAAEVQTLITVFGKLKSATGDDRARVQLCF
jgi:hypothetical protein